MNINILLPRSLVGRLVVHYVAAFYLLLGVAFLFLYWSIGTVLQKRVDNELREDVTEFSQILSNSGIDGVIEEMKNETVLEYDSSFLLLFKAPNEQVYATPMDYWRNFTPDKTKMSSASNRNDKVMFETREFEFSDTDARIAYAPLSPTVQLIMGESTEERDDIMQLLSIAFVSVFLLTLPIASALVWGITRRAVVGIHSVQNAALDLKRGNLSRRVLAVNQVEEVQTLADTFDSMAERIQQLIKDIQEMTENISHDLRTPIGRIRLLIESISAESDGSTETTRKSVLAMNECDRLITMINTSLDVSETEAGVVHNISTEIEMVELVIDACELFEALAEEKRIIVVREVIEKSYVRGQLNSIQRMVANLLDNAVKYTDYGGLITVKMSEVGEMLQIEITNSGFVIDEINYENIFNRFYRIDPSRSSEGCGLGLSYSRAVARAHGGNITVLSNLVDSNTFTITIPFIVSE